MNLGFDRTKSICWCADLADQYAQIQTAIYGQFLKALEGVILSAKDAGVSFSAHSLKQADRQFDEAKNVFLDMFINNWDEIYFLTSVESRLVELHLDAQTKEYGFGKTLDLLLSANHSTYKSALRFGGAFRGLSDRLANMHGAMGYIVQNKARQIDWKIGTADGKLVKCTRFVYMNCRHWCYLSAVYHDLYLAQENDIKEVGVGYEKFKNYPVKELLENKELFNSLFHFGSRNQFEQLYVI